MPCTTPSLYPELAITVFIPQLPTLVLVLCVTPYYIGNYCNVTE